MKWLLLYFRQKKTPEGHYGEIRIVRANSKYKQIMGSGYYDNCLYTEIVPKELNFEDFCYRSAVLKQHLHSYADTKAMDVWTDGTYLPLSAEYDTENLCHFLFLFEFTKKPSADKMAEVSADAAAFVLRQRLALSLSLFTFLRPILRPILIMTLQAA